MGNAESGPEPTQPVVDDVGRQPSSSGNASGLLSASKRQPSKVAISTTTTTTAMMMNNKGKKNTVTFQPPSMRQATIQEDERQPTVQYHHSSPYSRQEIRNAITPTTRNNTGATRYDPVVHSSSAIESIYSAGSILDDNSSKSSDQEGSQSNIRDENDNDDQMEVQKLLKKISALGTDVLEASAAVFHYLDRRDNADNDIDNKNSGGEEDYDDDLSVSARSHAVLTYVKNEALKGNTTEAYKFLETAKAVTEVLQENDDDDDDDNETTSILSPVNDRYAQLCLGRSGFGSDEYGVYNDDNQSISEESMAVFRILESNDDEGSVGVGSDDGADGAFGKFRSPVSKQKQQRQQVKVTAPPPSLSRDPPGEGSRDVFEKLTSGWYGALSPKSQQTLKASGGGGGKFGQDGWMDSNNNMSSERYLPDIPEIQSTADETDPGDGIGDSSSNDVDLDGVHPNSRDFEDGDKNDDYPVIRPIGTSHHPTVEGGGGGLDITDLPHLHIIDADMDLEFVENFDIAFNEFIAQHPVFLERFPDLVHHLRISKLQKLLEYNELKERNVMIKLTNLQSDKGTMEENMQLRLRDAAHKKAARQTLLQSELNNLSWSTKRIQTQLKWKFVQYSVDRANRQSKLRQQFKTIPHAYNRHDLLELIPNTTYGQSIRDAIHGVEKNEPDERPKFAFFVGDRQRVEKEEEERQIREYQMKNTALNEEISLLNKRLAYLQMDAKKFAWVESILQRIDESTMIRLKTNFQKKEGITN